MSIRVGTTISQSTSAERIVKTLGRPPQIRPKTRTSPAANRALVTSTKPPSSTGWALAAAELQQLPDGGETTERGQGHQAAGAGEEGQAHQGAPAPETAQLGEVLGDIAVITVPMAISTRAIGRG